MAIMNSIWFRCVIDVFKNFFHSFHHCRDFVLDSHWYCSGISLLYSSIYVIYRCIVIDWFQSHISYNIRNTNLNRIIRMSQSYMYMATLVAMAIGLNFNRPLGKVYFVCQQFAMCTPAETVLYVYLLHK